MGQDPTYLVRNDEILPQLYEGGRSTIADVPNSFTTSLPSRISAVILGVSIPSLELSSYMRVSLWAL